MKKKLNNQIFHSRFFLLILLFLIVLSPFQDELFSAHLCQDNLRLTEPENETDCWLFKTRILKKIQISPSALLFTEENTVPDRVLNFSYDSGCLFFRQPLLYFAAPRDPPAKQ